MRYLATHGCNASAIVGSRSDARAAAQFSIPLEKSENAAIAFSMLIQEQALRAWKLHVFQASIGQNPSAQSPRACSRQRRQAASRFWSLESMTVFCSHGSIT